MLVLGSHKIFQHLFFQSDGHDVPTEGSPLLGGDQDLRPFLVELKRGLENGSETDEGLSFGYQLPR